MKQAISAVLLAMFLAAGCAQPPVTRFEYGDIRLDVSGHVTKSKSLAMVYYKPGVYYSLNRQRQQVMIEARIVSVTLDDQEVLGMSWFKGTGPLIAATNIKNTTPMARPPIVVGGMIGTGGGGGIGRGRSKTKCIHGKDLDKCAKCSAGGDGTSLNVPIIAGIGGKESDSTLSVQATFDLDESIDIVESYLAIEIKIRTLANGNLIVQPLLIPIKALPEIQPPVVPPTKKITTAVRIEEGQTVLIGGLIEDKNEDIKKKVPILGDIPLLGRLFKSKDSKVTKRNLIIFVTPHIVR